MLRSFLYWLFALVILSIVWEGFQRFAPNVSPNISWVVGVVLLLCFLGITIDFILGFFGGGFIRWPNKNNPPQ